ncbi:MAG TPA: low-specificity L-threonine aldolase [Bacteroidota bacterium]|nr:low-specificity L-threonine aldolase [Bacteroidota bacterium]
MKKNKQKFIDLRSDTVTRPSRPMLEAMMNAEVGDDVFGEDPTVNALQKRVAKLFGKEDALFVPSGTMGNEICVKAHTQPGDEIIVEEESHIFVFETAGPSLLSGVQMQTVRGVKGVLPQDKVEAAIRYKAYYMPPTRLICLENTHGRSAGSVVPLENMKAISKFAKSKGISVHLDGARIWNASVASGVSFKEYGKCVDSISACFSKGLGTPAGSIVIGSKEFIEKARRYRKIFGGGMRQIGILAAAAMYALDHNIDRMKEDHKKARFLADRLIVLDALAIDLTEVQTNMVFIDIAKSGISQAEAMELLKNEGVLVTPERHTFLRAVMHLDVSHDAVEQAASAFKKVFA